MYCIFSHHHEKCNYSYLLALYFQGCFRHVLTAHCCKPILSRLLFSKGIVGGLCKRKMAAACGGALGRVGLQFLRTRGGIAGPVSSLVPRVPLQGAGRSYGTGGGSGFRSKWFWTLPGRRVSGRVLGCAFLLGGGGLGLYHTVKSCFHNQFAQQMTPQVYERNHLYKKK